jgi:hypothetical protein
MRARVVDRERPESEVPRSPADATTKARLDSIAPLPADANHLRAERRDMLGRGKNERPSRALRSYGAESAIRCC